MHFPKHLSYIAMLFMLLYKSGDGLHCRLGLCPIGFPPGRKQLQEETKSKQWVKYSYTLHLKVFLYVRYTHLNGQNVYDEHAKVFQTPFFSLYFLSSYYAI